MSADPCDNLDRYLDGELSREENTAFQIHLDQCATCRASLDRQRTVDRLLAASAPLEPTPGHLAARVDAAIRAASRRRAAAWGTAAVAAASVLLLGIVWTARTLPSDTPNEGIPVADRSTSNPAAPADLVSADPLSESQPPAHVTVRVNGSIVAPMPSSNPNITIFWVYPTVRATADRGDAPDSDDPSPSNRRKT